MNSYLSLSTKSLCATFFVLTLLSQASIYSQARGDAAKAPLNPKRTPLPNAVRGIPNYSPVEVDSSKYRVLRVRIENKGQTEVRPGTWIHLNLAIVDTGVTPIKHDGCFHWVDLWGFYGPEDVCFFARVHVTGPIKPGQSRWEIINLTHGIRIDKGDGELLPFEKIYLHADKLLIAASDKGQRNKQLGALISVEGGAKKLVSAVDKSFWIKK